MGTEHPDGVDAEAFAAITIPEPSRAEPRLPLAKTLAADSADVAAAAAASVRDEEWPIFERFDLQATLGEGANGAVYRAFDRERNTTVALKVLRLLSSDSILRFKHEFRSLQDLHHPNLVQMGELVEVAGSWLLTMELVDGPDFLEYVRLPAEHGFDDCRLRHALAQLTGGIDALHRAGHVHRDVKPSNVRVSGDRVVVLDFGLVAELGPERQVREALAVGTLPYMAPEQAEGRRVGPAADWYAVGVMLYESLTGRWPIEGIGFELVARKLREDPVPPRALVPDVPADLDALCVALLDRQPERRPDGDQLRARLDGRAALPEVITAAPMPFVGRAAERARLAQALERSRTSGGAVVVIEGESGMGKTALVNAFLAEHGELLALRGRCYERETVPYKAFDGIIDMLAHHLSELPRAERTALIPPDAEPLGRLFPVLGDLAGVGPEPGARRPPMDRVALREAAFAALRELIARLAAQQPLVLVIDDLQWADTESLELVAALLSGAEAPLSCLILVTTRPAGERTGELEAPADLMATLGAEHVHVAALPLDEATELARRLLPGGVSADAAGDLADHIARAAEGHPLFVDTLVRFGGDYGCGEVVDLDGALAVRVDRAGDDARALLTLAAIAGAPTPRAVLTRAADLAPDTFDRLAHALRLDHLLRTDVRDGEHTIDVFHDRIRTVLIARTTRPERAAFHQRLALALQDQERFDPGVLAMHWREAGDPASAARWAEQAGDAAMATLAFHRAARLYRTCLELAPSGPARRSLEVRLGDALAGAGRGAEAAAAYLQAVGGAPAAEALELRRRAAQHLLQSGRISEGRRVLDGLLAAVGLARPAGAIATIASVLWRRSRLLVRGLGFTPRSADKIPPATLTRIDTLWAAGASLAMVDTLRGADFQTRGLLAALDAGEPTRIARALAQEAAYQSTAEPPPQRRTRRLLATARGIADRLGDPTLLGSCLLMQGIADHCGMELVAARDRLLEAEDILRTRCSNVSWELDTCQYFLLFTLVYLGQLREVARRSAAYAREARDRDDLYGWIMVAVGVGYLADVVADRTDEAEAKITELMARWAQTGFLLPHWLALKARVEIALYRGGATAHRLLAAQSRAVERSMLLRARQVEVMRWTLRGRAALAAYCSGGGPELLAAVADDERRLLASPFYGARAWGHALGAGRRAATGDHAGAATALQRARDDASAWHMNHLVLAIDWILSDRARSLAADDLAGHRIQKAATSAETALRAQGVRSPARYAAMLVPGFETR